MSKASSIVSYVRKSINALDTMKYWDLNFKKFPTLSKLAQTYLALPASSAPVERLFSIAGKIFRRENIS